MAKKKNKKKENVLANAFKWINSLSPEKAGFIKEYANWQSKKDMKNTLNVLDRCMSAAIVNVLEIDWDTVKEIQDNMVNYLEEDTKKMKENMDLYGGLEMATKKINSSEKDVERRVNELINDGVKQREMVNTLSLEFPFLSKAMITNAIKRVKSERLKESEDAANYILEDNKALKEHIKEEAKAIAERVVNNLEEELEKEDVTEVKEEIQEEVKEEIVMSKLKVRKIELDGEFGSYVREGDKVTAGDITFNSLDELEEYKKREIELFNRRMEEIKAVYSIG